MIHDFEIMFIKLEKLLRGRTANDANTIAGLLLTQVPGLLKYVLDEYRPPSPQRWLYRRIGP